MSGALRRLIVAAAPHLRGPAPTPVIMWHVVASLAPVVVVATYFFGLSALLVISASVLGAVGTEHFFGKGSTLSDGSAAITGVLLGLTLPAGFPLWMAVVGGVFAIGVGKLLFGGLGYNVFNPALLGRAFLQATFPSAITTWPTVGGPWLALRGDNLAIPLARPVSDAITAATPLGLMKFEGKPAALTDLMIGTTGGSLGETAGLLILVCGAYLAARNFLNWRIPVAVLGSVAVFAGVLRAVDPTRYPSPAFELFAGGLMLGAVFMATDPVTAPVTNAGRWIFGIGVGVLVVIIRTWGGLPEGVMYAILLMNPVTPFINQLTQPRVFGTSRARVVV
jgi:electron transport complex protein RnfD